MLSEPLEEQAMPAEFAYYEVVRGFEAEPDDMLMRNFHHQYPSVTTMVERYDVGPATFTLSTVLGTELLVFVPFPPKKIPLTPRQVRHWTIAGNLKPIEVGQSE